MQSTPYISVIWRTWALAIFASGLSPQSSGVTEPPQLAASLREARALIEKDASRVPGLAVAVAWEGKIVWSEGFGYTDVDKKTLVSATTTRFRIASVSKPLTTAGLMLLVDRGLLDLDAPVQMYLPEYPVKPEGEITSRQLAGHLAGIRHYRWLEAFRNEEFPSVQAGLAIFKDDRLVSPPGAEFHYSTYGYSLLSAVMEAAAKREFLEFMQAEVFGALGMSHTGPDHAAVSDPNVTQFYKKSMRVEKPINSSYKWAGGGFLSSADDLAIFGSALLQPGFLQERSLAQLFTIQKPTKPTRRPADYGMGWGIVENNRGRTFYLHQGDQQGAKAMLMILPKAKVVVAILCNQRGAKLLSRDDPMILVRCFDALSPVPLDPK